MRSLKKEFPSRKIDRTVIDRLAEFWPEPREQLHFGGWKATYDLVERLDVLNSQKVLDICCGEGSTACWLAKEHGLDVNGIDILDKAISVARERAETQGISDLVDFKVGDKESWKAWVSIVDSIFKRT